jgi:ribonuclease P protein component
MSSIDRLHRRRDFATASRGARAGTSTMVVSGAVTSASTSCRVGYAIPRSVGSAVVRNRLRRQLRAIVAKHAHEFPVGGLVIVRVQVAATSSTFAELEADLIRCVQRWRQRAETVG